MTPMDKRFMRMASINRKSVKVFERARIESIHSEGVVWN